MGKVAFLGLGLILVVVATVVYACGRSRYENRARLIAFMLSSLAAIMLCVSLFMPANVSEYTVVYENDGQLTLLDEATGSTRKVDLNCVPHESGIYKGSEIFVVEDAFAEAQFVGVRQNLISGADDDAARSE